MVRRGRSPGLQPLERWVWLTERDRVDLNVARPVPGADTAGMTDHTDDAATIQLMSWRMSVRLRPTRILAGSGPIFGCPARCCACSSVGSRGGGAFLARSRPCPGWSPLMCGGRGGTISNARPGRASSARLRCWNRPNGTGPAWLFGLTTTTFLRPLGLPTDPAGLLARLLDDPGPFYSEPGFACGTRLEAFDDRTSARVLHVNEDRVLASMSLRASVPHVAPPATARDHWPWCRGWLA